MNWHGGWLSRPPAELPTLAWHRLAGRLVNRAFACPGCGETERLVPHAKRCGADGRSYDLWICRACTAVINSTDLCGAGDRFISHQAEASAEFYALSAEAIDGLPEEVGKNGSLVAFLLDHCPGLGRDAFLDFGAGRGCLASAATDAFRWAFALELDLTMLRQVHPHLPNRDRITLASGPDGLPPLDAIAAFHVLEHLPDVKLVLDPFVSRLKPGGALFFQVPLLRNDYLVNTHYTFFGEPAARAACHRLGLAVAGVWYDEAKDLLTCIARRPLAAGA